MTLNNLMFFVYFILKYIYNLPADAWQGAFPTKRGPLRSSASHCPSTADKNREPPTEWRFLRWLVCQSECGSAHQFLQLKNIIIPIPVPVRSLNGALSTLPQNPFMLPVCWGNIIKEISQLPMFSFHLSLRTSSFFSGRV